MDEVAPFRCILARWHHVRLRQALGQQQKAFPALHSHGLEILDLFCIEKSTLCPGQPVPKLINAVVRLLLLVAHFRLHHACVKADMEGERVIQTRKQLLRIQVRRPLSVCTSQPSIGWPKMLSDATFSRRSTVSSGACHST